jgi:conjugal transfer pilus assembly protein TraF
MIKNLSMKFIVLFYCLFYCVILSAENHSYFNDHARGWHWYETQNEIDDTEEDNENNNDPITQMNAVQQMVKRALDQAILNPTIENVEHYIALYIAVQNQVTAHTARFSKLWQEALLRSPHLDFSLRHPINNIARQVEVDQENAEETAAIKKLAETSGLFFFYRSTCPYCKAFSPILKRFTDHYNIQVMPITTDGISLPEFPRSVTDQGQSKTFQVKVEPALYMVNPYNHQAIPVGFGLMSEMDLKKRILEIARKNNNKI